MYNENDYLVYKKDVCIVKEIKKSKIDDSIYYVLVPVSDNTLKIEVPAANRLGYIRDLISKEEVKRIINKIPNIEIIEVDDKNIENKYKELLQKGGFEDLIKIIKTTYLRNKSREENKKKLSDKDSHYFKLAEKYLYTEFSIVLNMSYDDTKKYIEDTVKKLDTNE